MTRYKGQVLDWNNWRVELCRLPFRMPEATMEIYLLYNISCTTFGHDQVEHYCCCSNRAQFWALLVMMTNCCNVSCITVFASTEWKKIKIHASNLASNSVCSWSSQWSAYFTPDTSFLCLMLRWDLQQVKLRCVQLPGQSYVRRMCTWHDQVVQNDLGHVE